MIASSVEISDDMREDCVSELYIVMRSDAIQATGAPVTFPSTPFANLQYS